MLIDACRPFKWLDQFPAVNAFTKEYKQQIADKFKIIAIVFDNARRVIWC